MGKLLKIIKNISPEFENAIEYKFKKYLKSDVAEELRKAFVGNVAVTNFEAEFNGISGDRRHVLLYEPRGDFDYYTSESCLCNGDPHHMDRLIEKIIYNVMNCRTYNKKSIPADYETDYWDYNVRYTVGDFVLHAEELPPEQWENPEKNVRFTAMLPLKCEWFRK
jgi:hypothetical protein